MTVTILIPAHNEEASIGKTLGSILETVQPDYDVIVIADHCTDGTEDVVRSLQEKHSQLTLLRNEGEKGFGNTLTVGIEHATGDLVVPIMADACDDPSTVNRMRDVLSSGSFDVVCASRYMQGGRKIGGPWIQDKLSRFVCFTLRLWTRVPTRDCANSYKMYRRAFLQSIDYRIAGAGTEYSMALLFRAYDAGARITEIPTTWTGKSIPFLREWKIFRRTAGYWHWYKQAFLHALKWMGIGRN